MILLGFLPVLLFLIAGAADIKVSRAARGLCHDTTGTLTQAAAGLILGTAGHLKNGRPNRYFEYRLEAGALLYKSGKVKTLIVSGRADNRGYNEPEEMKAALIKRGVPEETILTDPKGSRTILSILNARQTPAGPVIIVSQKFHNQRALYQANALGLPAQGFNAKDVSIKSGLKTRLREVFARLVMLLELQFIRIKK